MSIKDEYSREIIRLIVDSGASTHMIPYIIMLCKLRSARGNVVLGNKQRLPIAGISDTNISNITEVLYVPSLSIGVLSVGKFDRDGCTTTLGGGVGIVRDKDGEVVLTCTLARDGLYDVDPLYMNWLVGCDRNVYHNVSQQILDSHSNTSNTILVDACVKPSERVNSDDVTVQDKYPEGSDHNVEIDNSEEALVNSSIMDNTVHDMDTTKYQEVRPEGKVPMGVVVRNNDIPLSVHNYSVMPVLNQYSNTSMVECLHVECDPNYYLHQGTSSVGLTPKEVLHRQWGHISEAAIENILRHHLVEGCPYRYEDIKNEKMRVCFECLEGRMRAKSSDPVTDHDWKPLEKVAVDFKGYFTKKSTRGHRGFMLYVDYKTNHCYPRFVKSKAEHVASMKDYKVYIVGKYNKTWKTLQSDSESIFKSKRVENWLRSQEMTLQLSTPYQHWQNGQVEVYVGIVMNKSRTLMKVYNTPSKYWDYAVDTACHLINMFPTAGRDISAIEELSGVRPDVSRLVPFYAPGVFHLTGDERKDPFSPKAEPCRMLGYATKHYKDAYYVLNLRTNKVVVREHCSWDISLDADDLHDTDDIDTSADRNDLDAFRDMIEETGADSDEEDDDDGGEGYIPPEVENEDSDSEDADDDVTGGEYPYWEAFNISTHLEEKERWRQEVVGVVHKAVALPNNPRTISEALGGPDAEKWKASIQKELNQFRDRDTFAACEQHGRGMKTKVLLQYKYDGDYNIVCKTRMVVCGYSQVKGRDYTETFSPTTTTSTIFLLLHLAGTYDLHASSFDVSGAFLEGKADTEMYAWLPPEIDDRGVSVRVKILGNWYGSKQAGKIWNDMFHKVLIDMGFIQCPVMACLYKWTNNEHYVYITIHVDDGLLITNTPTLANTFIIALQDHVNKVVLYDTVSLYLGMDIERQTYGRWVRVTQRRYIEDEFANSGNYKTRTPLSGLINLRVQEPNHENDSLLPDIGRVRYLADRTRPDILAAVGEISSGGADSPSDKHVEACEKLKHYLKRTKDAYIQLGGHSTTKNGRVEMFAYSDAAYIQTGNCRSRLGGCIFMGMNSGAIYSFSTNDTTVSHSSTEAEIKAIDKVAREVVYQRDVLEFLGQKQEKPTRIYVDNKSAIELCRTLKVKTKVKHVNIRIHYIRELINNKVIELVFVPTEYNVADVLTKGLRPELHERHTGVLLYGHEDVDASYMMNCVVYSIDMELED
jgi:hypothetical protein